MKAVDDYQEYLHRVDARPSPGITMTPPTTALNPLIKREPCFSCDDVGREGETGYSYCRRSPHGDHECSVYLDVRQLETVAVQLAAIVRHLEDQEMRRELAAAICDGLANALYVRDQSTQIDCDEFLRRAGGLREGAV